MACCECGCGEETLLYTTTDPRIGAIKGQPARFVRGHRMRKKATMQEVIDDIKRVLALTECHEFPSGDLRVSTYFTPGMGRFSKDTLYSIFGSYPNALEYIFPEGVERRQNKLKVSVEAERKYVYTPRTCLAPDCGKTFMSWGAENRRCEDCATAKDYTDGDEYDEPYELCIPGMEGTLV
jgi:hypothetical protein